MFKITSVLVNLLLLLCVVCAVVTAQLDLEEPATRDHVLDHHDRKTKHLWEHIEKQKTTLEGLLEKGSSAGKRDKNEIARLKDIIERYTNQHEEMKQPLTDEEIERRITVMNEHRARRAEL
mmetsp:Transcript_16189/g.37516  ORF Transcript_16189/g.37516 Transcript_16189/m.37516 type:complete len:121 (+) Transcript_16189:84-446(+)